MSNELLEKAAAAGATVSTGFGSTTGGVGTHVGSEAGNGGLLNPEQSARFLDYMFDATVIGKVARTVRMKSDTTEIDRMSVGEKLMKLASEGENTGANSAVTFSKISLTTKKLRMDWELSTESLEDNIEGADLEDHIARLMLSSRDSVESSQSIRSFFVVREIFEKVTALLAPVFSPSLASFISFSPTDIRSISVVSDFMRTVRATLPITVASNI